MTQPLGAIRSRWDRVSVVGLPLLGATIMIGAWWAATIVFNIREVFLPAPPDIVVAFTRMPDNYLMEMAWVTLSETLVGFGIAAVSGLVIAVVLAASRLVERATMPLMVSVNAIPKLALAPLLIVWMGFGFAPKVVMVVLISFFPIVVAAMSGLSSTPAELGELAKSLTAGRWQTFIKVRFPCALPQIFVGLKIAISLAVIGAVVAEFNASDKGLGFVIVASGLSADTPVAFAAIVLLALMSVTLFYIVSGIERLLLPWARATTAS